MVRDLALLYNVFDDGHFLNDVHVLGTRNADLNRDLNDLFVGNGHLYRVWALNVYLVGYGDTLLNDDFVRHGHSNFIWLGDADFDDTLVGHFDGLSADDRARDDDLDLD